ncbi:DUF4065 domain-containing protein [Patescibacteria group bacterium]|nr:DUF4065 domain-containing protein [Patescibacteria group bacterium]MBU1519169.1 DUF4065 domain-containing protein [Patescibacteria group bacterium]MBU1730078.1 DUF4065 domain-containing protein [Patescibacteria group bacterium]MBU2010178.1 DUF4065 domain-containing protein [Patescibacteria group bacterium]MBU2416869.1 DUF4065 domain-containing protein [Patescibacteria group bacterium]
MNMLGNFILEQRKKRNLTQEFLASKIGVSRPTYVQIEQGKHDLTLSKAKKLADVFGIDFNDFITGKIHPTTTKIQNIVKKIKEEKQEIRISVPQKNLEKFREVLLYVLSKVGSKPNVGEAVIYKLLYFIDFDFYEKFEEQLVGATYIKNHYGPTPVEFKTVVDNMIKNGEVIRVEEKYFNYPQRKYLPIRESDLTKLKDARELHHIDEVIARLGAKNATELSEYSHEDTPWLVAKENQPLDYEAVFYRTPKTSVRNYDE